MSVIPKEQLGGFQRWQFNSFDSKPATTSPPEASPPPEPLEEAPAAEAPRETVTVTEEITGNPCLPSAEDIERIYEEARENGHAAGLAEGLAAAEKDNDGKVQAAVEHIATLVSHLEHSLAEIEQSVAEQVLTLALEVARQMAQASIKAQADYLLPIIKEAIASLPLHHAHITLHLNPLDASQLRHCAAEQLNQQNLQIQENPEITRGGCRLTAGTSEVDASAETRWTRVLEAIGTEPQAWLQTK